MCAEAKAFSGTVTYTKKFNIENFRQGMQFVLDLGKVDMVAEVFLNGVRLRTLWCAPYKLDVGNALKAGENELTVKVTGTWFNRLVFDAGQPESIRKTWTIRGPKKDVPLRDIGLCGPVVIEY